MTLIPSPGILVVIDVMTNLPGCTSDCVKGCDDNDVREGRVIKSLCNAEDVTQRNGGEDETFDSPRWSAVSAI